MGRMEIIMNELPYYDKLLSERESSLIMERFVNQISAIDIENLDQSITASYISPDKLNKKKISEKIAQERMEDSDNE